MREGPAFAVFIEAELAGVMRPFAAHTLFA